MGESYNLATRHSLQFIEQISVIFGKLGWKKCEREKNA